MYFVVRMNGLCSNCTDLNGPGYCPDVGKPNKGDGKGLVPHPIESQAVKLAFELYATGEYSDGKVATFLNEQEIPGKDGEIIHFRTKGTPNRLKPGPLAKDTVRGMLLRIFYAGKIAYYGTDETGQKRRRSDLLEVYQGKHPALITEDTFQNVQEIREIMSSNPKEKFGLPVHVFPLSGVLRCGYCDAKMRGVSTNREYLYYRDASQIEKRLECNQPLVKTDVIEPQVVAFLRQVLDDLSPKEGLQNIEHEIAEAEKRFDRAKFLFLSGDMAKEKFEEEKLRKEEIVNNLRNDDYNAIIALYDLIRNTLAEWDRTLPTDRKRGCPESCFRQPLLVSQSSQKGEFGQGTKKGGRSDRQFLHIMGDTDQPPLGIHFL